MAPHGEEGTLMAVVILAGVVEVAGEVGPAGVVEVAGVPAQHTGAVALGQLLVSVSLSLILMASSHMNESKTYTQVFLNINCCLVSSS